MAAIPIVLTTLLLAVQGPDSLTLRDALERAGSARPGVAVATAGVDRARGAHRIAVAIPNPSAQFQNEGVADVRKLTVAQPLTWLPRYGAERAVGRAVMERAAADSAALVANVGREVRLAFFGALAAEERLRLAREQAAHADSLVGLADRRLAVGDVSILDREQLALEASLARLASLQAREAARAARVELARATASSLESPPRPVGSLEAGLSGGEAAQPAESAATVDGLSRVPALRAAVADSAATAARLRSARLAQLPLPGFVAEHEWSPDPLFGSRTRIGLAVQVPLWSQGREAVAEARGAASEGSARAAEARLAAAAAIETARIRVGEAAERARFARDALLPEALRVRVQTVRLYAAGETGVAPVLEALRREREVAGILVQESLAFQQARADLIALLGEGE